MEKENTLVGMMKEALDLYEAFEKKQTKAGATRLRVKLSEIAKECKEERKAILATAKSL